MKFMVVDDSNFIRVKIQEALGQQYEIVGTAGDGEEAVEEFIKLRPQLMTMDITMPKMDGVETIKKILKIDDSVRILVISALADKATLIQALTFGAYGFLCKPFTTPDLLDAVDELVDGMNQ